MDVHPASLQDRDGAETLLRQARRRFPFVERIIGDGSYQGPKMTALVACAGARTLAWVSRNRRLSRDYERPSAASQSSRTTC